MPQPGEVGLLCLIAHRFRKGYCTRCGTPSPLQTIRLIRQKPDPEDVARMVERMQAQQAERERDREAAARDGGPELQP